MRTQPLSIRFELALLERLRRRARTLGTSPSTLAQQLVEEGMRMAEHPGIVFRDGPAGRRAGLANGPDVWEVMAVLQREAGGGQPGLTAATEGLGLTERQVRTAVAYFSPHTSRRSSTGSRTTSVRQGRLMPAGRSSNGFSRDHTATAAG